MAHSLTKIKFNLLNDSAKLPTAAKDGDVGYDLVSTEEVEIPHMGTRIIKTGLQICSVDVPTTMDLLMKIEGRSGLAVKTIFPTGGVIDTKTYTGEIGVILNNFSGKEYKVSVGDRIAQAVFYVVLTTPQGIVLGVGDGSVKDTARNSSGFGSSGK